MKHREEESYKIILLGNSGTGKTSIIDRKRLGTTAPDLHPTIGCNSTDMVINLKDKSVKLKVWDTAGQEEYKSIVPIYTRGAHAALLVFDVTDMSSIQSLDGWRSMLLESEPTEVPFFVVGNKIDMKSENTISREIAQTYATRYSADLYFVSALSGQGINELFEKVAEKVSERKSFEKDPAPKEVNHSNSGGCC
ncbi:small GTP-binding protein, putative [Trichomonas vaginalis G3]|uniref:Small GTP-binding protein, putative n=1 Tax=Trichomonas vaginalis (strain ATCC PRA-98 / G3) TaxID=412133 RepID=A2E5L9_TRIV3|nr:craniofacial suture morphogenesis protein family [Trichomonas vaginalis G3]EAY12060.1 small GTP-binding protein, putative [Trichomonas vaginalis G3]KAI5553256.1 craniofacial suture morphogenesis protein family [Trichomonas vaginalis G3]|eukprot:XP_001324283.1 small GTP-binding protein [Trichomonas vaginalis G3]